MQLTNLYTSLTLINLSIVIIWISHSSEFKDIAKWVTHPAFLGFLAFILTNIFGQKIIFDFQLRKFKFEEHERKKSEQLKQASHFFEEFSQRLDKRLYHERKLLSSCKDREAGMLTGNDIDNVFNNYTSYLYEWNTNLNISICKLEQYFGREIAEHYQNRIMQDFNWIRILLKRKYLLMQNAPTHNGILKAINITNDRVYKIDKQMLVMIKNETVGSFIEKSNV